jgi:hypothetical protein
MFDRIGNLASLPGILIDYGAQSCAREQELAQSVAPPSQTTDYPLGPKCCWAKMALAAAVTDQAGRPVGAI